MPETSRNANEGERTNDATRSKHGRFDRRAVALPGEVDDGRGDQFEPVVTERGLLGDRSYALVDLATGKVVSAKNPRKWPGMFGFRAAYVEPPDVHEGIPPVRITMPEGVSATSTEANLDSLLSRTRRRAFRCNRNRPASPQLEEYRPDIDDLAHRETVTEEAMPPPGTFFDGAVVHILTTATLKQLQTVYPQGSFEARRFRPNLIVAPREEGFVENSWVGRTLVIGEGVRLKVTCATGRCVMTTLPQGALPKDLGILKTAVSASGESCKRRSLRDGRTLRSNPQRRRGENRGGVTCGQ